MSVVLSMGPFLYAYFVKRSAYFHEHTIAGLAHELKSPLGVIESATSLLLDDLENPTTNKAKLSEYLQMIQSNTSRLQGFAQNLIHAAKDQDDDITIARQSCDLAAIIETARAHWQTQASQKNIHLTYEGPSQANIEGDQVKLHQIVSNLFSNAVKFSEGGEIRVSLVSDETMWKCSIHDQGCGIAEKNLKKIFTRFFQARPGSKGTGIGLTIAKAWVEAHGGKIWAESEGEGRGTTVRFTLPTNL
jgi:two-component system phosphate regulon sensor histidine kinase PhoR